MAFALYLRRENFQPEEPQILDRETSDDKVNFTFVDLVPGIIKRSGTRIPTSQVEYHSFGSMVHLANGWLQKHGQHWQVVNLETIMLLYKYNDATSSYEIKPNHCCFYIYGSEKNNVLKALRMWVRRRTVPVQLAQIICHRDLVPLPKQEADQFDTLDDVVDRFNAHMRHNGLDARRILTIESLSYEANNDWQIETDLTLSAFSHKNVYILRVFYEQADDQSPLMFSQIDIQDFQPELIRKANFFRRPTFETFDMVIEKASRWLRMHSHSHRFINAQSIDIKMQSVNTEVNTRRMAHTEHGNYMRIFRLALLKLAPVPDTPPLFLATKLFLPGSKTDTISMLKLKLSDWFNTFLDKYRYQMSRSCPDLSDSCGLPYPDILSAETVEVFAKDVRSENARDIKKAANVDTFLANRFGNKNAYLFFSLRLFYDNSSMSSSASTTLTTAGSISTFSASEDGDQDEQYEHTG